LNTFDFWFTPAYRAAGLCFGITPNTTEAVLTPSDMSVRFGPWRVQTSLDNIEEVAITGPYVFLKTAGPARLALTDRGLTFATNGHRGVLLSFRSPIKGIEPTGLLRHPELTLTVADVDGFAARVRELTVTAL
jgi:hypothetical protein